MIALVVVLVVVLAGAPAASGQTTDDLKALRQSIESLKESQQRIEKELGEIKTLLRGRSAAPAPDDDPKNVALSLAGEPFRGQPAAKLVLVDFTDYQ